MNKTNPNTTEYALEQSLAMYKETVSPSQDMLMEILNQIPEKKKDLAEERRAIRSPYIWVAVTQFVSVFILVLALLPIRGGPASYADDPFYAVDMQVDEFEKGINDDDYRRMLIDYTL